MKLREQFNTEFSINTSGESGRFADKCEKISDNHAIDFTEWCVKNEIFYSIQYGRIEIKSLLEIYKKEKNL